jgi:hypothetical protein
MTVQRGTYRLKVPTVAVQPGASGKMCLKTIEAGSILRIHGTTQDFGLIDVMCDGELVAMFARDIEERATRVTDHSVGAAG